MKPASSRPIAVATCREFSALYPDDHPMLAAIRSAGIAAEPVVWDDDLDWTRFSAVLLRIIKLI